MYLGSPGEGVVPFPQLTVASAPAFYIQSGFFPHPWERRFLSPLVTALPGHPVTALCDSVLWPASPGLQGMTPYDSPGCPGSELWVLKSWCLGTSLEDGL